MEEIDLNKIRETVPKFNSKGEREVAYYDLQNSGRKWYSEY